MNILIIIHKMLKMIKNEKINLPDLPKIIRETLMLVLNQIKESPMLLDRNQIKEILILSLNQNKEILI